MKSRKWNRLFPCLLVLISPWIGGASLHAETCPPSAAESQPTCTLADERSARQPIILAEMPRDQCLERCTTGRQACADHCPGFDENNVVDPSYAARRCKTACDKDLAQCRSRCPKE